MKNSRLVQTALLIMTIMVLAAGCAGLTSFPVGIATPGREAGSPGESGALGAFSNNSRVQLEAGTYRGGFVIDANKVTLTGKGAQSTLIRGNIRIDGNSCTLRNLKVRGNVHITGNNADLTRALIEGRVTSSGQNNRW